MTADTKRFLLKFLKKHTPKGKVLEVGSRFINGSVKEYCTSVGLKYTGLDMIAGINVDVVGNAHDIKEIFKPESFDVVICFDTLEHDNKFWISVENMRWVLKKGGWLIMCTPSCAWSIHAWPNDYYRFLPSVYKEIFFEGYTDTYFYALGDPMLPAEVFGWGKKP